MLCATKIDRLFWFDFYPTGKYLSIEIDFCWFNIDSYRWVKIVILKSVPRAIIIRVSQPPRNFFSKLRTCSVPMLLVPAFRYSGVPGLLIAPEITSCLSRLRK